MGVRLLDDVRTLFGDAEAMFTTDLLRELNSLDEAPWGELYGKELNPRGLAQRLRKYDVSSKTVRIGDDTAKGYTREDLWDAWEPYLPPNVTDKTLAKASSYSIPKEAGNTNDGMSPNGNVTNVTSDTGQDRPGLDYAMELLGDELDFDEITDFAAETDRIAP